jgi:ABC-2 type transport system ATP-binding protein
MTTEYPKPFLRLRGHDLVVAYGDVVALNCPVLETAGSIIAIVGHNGAGKSTLIKAVLGLLPIRGTLATTIQKQRFNIELRPDEHMAFCPETGAVFSDITVESYIRLWCRIKRFDANYYMRAGSRYIELLELGPLLKRLGRELSKGQRRRVQTAIGFLTGPELFLFDEPFDGLDVQKTSALAQIIKDESRNMGFVISSHRMDVVERIADMVLVLHGGNLIAQGDPAAVARSLCGRSAVLTVADTEKMAAMISKHLPETVLTVQGERITVSGSSVSIQRLRTCAASAGIKCLAEADMPPSLVDAINYLLKNSPAGTAIKLGGQG